MTDWSGLAGWWSHEVRDDPAYAEDVLPLLVEALAPRLGERYVDLGCGEGQGMRAVAAAGASVLGCDVSVELLAAARTAGPVVRCRLPDLGWLRPAAVDGAYAVLVIEHLPEVAGLFAAARRAVRGGGVLAIVSNHPAYTAPGAGPFVDPADGEVLWRWGPYLRPGQSEEPAGEATVTFHHRPLGDLLNAAAAAGWSLEWLAERAVGEAAAARDPLLAAQRHIPRLLAARWRTRPLAGERPDPSSSAT